MKRIWPWNNVNFKIPRIVYHFFKSDIVKKVSRFSSIPEWKEAYQCNSPNSKESKGIKWQNLKQILTSTWNYMVLKWPLRSIQKCQQYVLVNCTCQNS